MVYDSIDLAFDLEGDIPLNDNGDLLTTEFDVLVGIIQQMHIRTKYPASSWELNPTQGVSKLPMGELNIPEVGDEWEDDIFVALTSDGLVDPGDLEIDIAPLSENTFITLLRLHVDPTAANGGRTLINMYALIDNNTKRILFY